MLRSGVEKALDKCGSLMVILPLLSSYYEPGTVVGAFPIWILATTLWDKCYYCPHFVDEKVRTEKLSNLPKTTQLANGRAKNHPNSRVHLIMMPNRCQGYLVPRMKNPDFLASPPRAQRWSSLCQVFTHPHLKPRDSPFAVGQESEIK